MKTLVSSCVLSLFALGTTVQAATVPPPASPPKQEEQGLTAQLLYEFLLGEIAGQRGDLALAGEAYSDLAVKTRDPRVARRAAEIAIYGHDMAKAVAMSKLWVELEPSSVQANRFLVSALIDTGRLDEAKPRLDVLMHMPGVSQGEVLVQLQSLLARSPDKAATLKFMKGVAAAYPDLPEAHQVVAQSAIDAGQPALARTETDAMLRLSPASELAALLKGEALSGQGDAAVLDFWHGFLAAHPEASRVRLAYARELTRVGRYADARKEFETMAQGAPGNPEFYLAIGLLDMQMNDLDDAEKQFTKTLDLGYPDDDLVKLYLGQVEELRKQYDKALAWYDKVEDGGHVLQARLKGALVMAKLGRTDEAVARLKKLESERKDGRVRIVQTEAQLLRDAGRYQEADDLLSAALAKTPDEGDLIYDRAMIEEKLDRLQDMEADLRHLIKLQPSSAQAYNALGYTLVDRTTRVDEGIALLDKALALSPDDPFILDSMGWGQFKAGHLDQAVDYLRRAYKGRADPEIAAHLGEVLWQKGEHTEAGKLWRDALKADPDNTMLRQTMSRFGQ